MTNICKNCNTPLKGKFCYQCGQDIVNPADKTLRHILSEFLHFFTHLNNKFFKTLKNILTRPGLVTKDISEGITIRHLKLTSLYLIGTLIYFLLPSNFIVNVGYLNTPLRVQLEGSFLMEWKSEIVKSKVKNNNTAEPAIAAAFYNKQHYFGKIVTIVLIPLTIPVLLLVSLFIRLVKRNHNYTAYDLGVASLEINSIIVFGLFLITGLVLRLIILFTNSEMVFRVLSFFFLTAILVLLLQFFKRAYQLRWWQAVISLIVFLFGFSFVIELYRLISFMLFI